MYITSRNVISECSDYSKQARQLARTVAAHVQKAKPSIDAQSIHFDSIRLLRLHI